MSTSVNILATITPKPDQVENTRQQLQTVAAASRQEPGCLRYDVFQGNRDGETTFHIVERYQDRAAVEVHGASQHFQALRERAADLLAKPWEIIFVQDVDVAL
ncbi:hypothetical protein KSC_087940 [Ktedonobacter sp. SOSP1-52]|uniref:putative quinol monooxygenase n=1 Tax=Ktedonobacter sp. SOSP1-52 TaxID=2778366 RepID=UPI001915A65D|nr:putative quinol monooxygenase [Ktedonobacter sp. SOSP1-52]GHO69902.1 hypothetical protein KSC_087940 [Ktedonobacter sp. SOSP1-52]